MATSAWLGISTPVDGDPVDIPADLVQLVAGIDKRGIGFFANAAARDAAATAAGGATAGMVAYLTTPKQLTVYDGTAWRGVRSTEYGPGAPAANGSTSGTTEKTVCTLTIPDQGCAGIVKIWGLLMCDATVNGDAFEVQVKAGAFQAGGCRIGIAGNIFTATPVGRSAQAAGATTSLTLTVKRNTGTGTASHYFDSGYCALHAIFVPT